MPRASIAMAEVLMTPELCAHCTHRRVAGSVLGCAPTWPRGEESRTDRLKEATVHRPLTAGLQSGLQRDWIHSQIETGSC